MKLEESSLARRRFLCRMIGGGAAALGAGVIGPLVEYAGDFHPSPPPEFVTLEKSVWDIPPGQSNMVLYGNMPVLLLRPPGTQSTLRVFSATCTHLNCTVSYQPAENRIFCACHNGVYSTDGRVLSGPPPRPLRQFYSKQIGDKLVIALEKANLEKAS